MGRLDDAAKRKVVELRQAGLSFRKIKAVLELENIKVSAQAIYLFLKEFNGKGRHGDLSMLASSSPAAVLPSRDMGISELRQGGWNEQQFQNLLQKTSSHVTGFSSSPDSSGQSGVPLEARAQSSGTGAATQDRQDEEKKDEDVRIISVTSLAHNAHHGGLQATRSGAITSTHTRRRYTPSPANPVLVARKRILDKALLHRARVRDNSPQSGHHTVSLLRRDQTCFPFSEGRKIMLPQTTSYNSATNRPPEVRGLHPGTNVSRQDLQQRANVLPRSNEPAAHVGVRLPVPGQSSNRAQNSSSTVRAQATNQQSTSCQQSGMDSGGQSALQDQVKFLASEVRSLSLALRMMVEQQGRLEREQSQQTQVQKQILSTLQNLATKLEPCVQHTTALTIPSCPLSSASYSQSTLTSSQTQSRYNEINGPTLENIDSFSLEGLNSATINGFPPCSSSDSISFTQNSSQTFTPEMMSYTQTHPDTYIGMDGKPVEMTPPNTDGSFQACQSASTDSVRVHDSQLTIVKVENV